MSFTFTCTLVPHPAAPGGVFPGIGAGLSRHHVLGQKYLQVLLALSRATGVAETTLQRFAGRPINPRAPFPTDWASRFYWSPFDLFEGPEGTLRVFDPSSGVEQQRPRSFPGALWAVLKAVPEYLDKIGVPLAELVTLPAGHPRRWTLTDGETSIRDSLTDLLKAISNTSRADHVHLHGLVEADWAVVREVDVRNLTVRNEDDVQGIYDAVRKMIVAVDFDRAIASGAYRFVLLP